MREVNLARRRFVNRRPIFRLAVLLWILGAALALINYRLYSGHWSGTDKNRLKIVEADQQISEQRKQLGELDRELARINLSRENRRTDFLNALISHRTFPWSALFEDLEQVVPMDVRLLSVSPKVNLVAEPPTARRQRKARSSRRRRSNPPPAETAAASATQTAKKPPALKRNEVGLSLKCVAKSEDAMVEFVDGFYGSPDFRRPFLPGEGRTEQGTSSFNMTVVYLTRPPESPEVEVPAAQDAEEILEAEETLDAEEAPAGTVVAETSDEESDDSETEDDSSERARIEAAEKSEPATVVAQPQAPRPGAPAAGQEAGRAGAPAEPTRRNPPQRRPPVGDRPTMPSSSGRDGRGTADPSADPTPDVDAGFADPSASGTPRLRNGSLPVLPIPDFPVPVRALPREVLT